MDSLDSARHMFMFNVIRFALSFDYELYVFDKGFIDLVGLDLLGRSRPVNCTFGQNLTSLQSSSSPRARTWNTLDRLDSGR